MNKYLMLSAAAVMASTTANAGTLLHSFQFGTSGGGSYCDGGTVYSSGSTVWSWTHNNNNCGSGRSFGQGLVGKNAAFGKSADMSDNFYSKNYGSNYVYLSYTLPKKLAAGKPWELWVGFSGTTSFFANSGVLVNVVPGHKGTKATTSGLKALIAVHKASKHS